MALNVAEQRELKAGLCVNRVCAVHLTLAAGVGISEAVPPSPPAAEHRRQNYPNSLAARPAQRRAGQQPQRRVAPGAGERLRRGLRQDSSARVCTDKPLACRYRTSCTLRQGVHSSVELSVLGR